MAFALTDPTAAVTLPVPGAVPAVKVVEAPEVGLNDEPVSVVLQAGVTTTALPWASAPVAANTWVAPAATVAVEGESVIEASGPAATVTGRVAELSPLAEAVTVWVPAIPQGLERSVDRRSAAILLRSAPDLDIVFCGNDEIARGVADGLRDLGRAMPEDWR